MYLINEVKFLEAIDKGETFITSHRMVTSKRTRGEVIFKQEFSYRFDIEFINANKKKLIKLGILQEKEEKNEKWWTWLN